MNKFCSYYPADPYVKPQPLNTTKYFLKYFNFVEINIKSQNNTTKKKDP